MSAFTAANIRARRRAETDPLVAARAFEREVEEVRKSTRPALLNTLKSVYMSRGQTAKSLADLTGLSPDRIRALSNATMIEEPWFDEAVLLHRALGTSGILQLMTTSGDLASCPMGVRLAEDITAFRAGMRMPLSLACRIALRFGLSDPAELVVTPLQMQMWDILNATERHPEAPGWCAWCGADIIGGQEHLPTCLPNNLWAPRNQVPYEDVFFKPRPRAPGQRRSFSAKARGLKALRLKHGRNQKNIADAVGMSANHYSRVERGEIPLTAVTAEKLAALFRVPVETIYAEPEIPLLEGEERETMSPAPPPLPSTSTASSEPYSGSERTIDECGN